jgi:hypothetical protein
MTSNVSQLDTDGNGAGDACDPDDDNDGVLDGADCEPLVPGASPPAEVGASLIWSTGSDFGWTAVAAARGYPVYRGTLISLHGGSYDHACRGVSSSNAATDGSIPPVPGDGYYYVVSARNLCGESGLGSGAAGPRPNPSPCP